MRWIILPALAFGLSLTPSLRADGPVAAGGTLAKYLELSPGSDALSLARERARQICLQGTTPLDLGSQTSPRFLTLDAPKDASAGVVYAWAVPDGRSRDHRSLVLAAKILTGDPAAGLAGELVARRLASGISAGILGQSGLDLLVLQVPGTKSVKLEEVEVLVDAALSRLATQGPDASELERANTALEAEIVGRAGAGEEAREFARAYRAVGADDVRRAVLAYLVPSRRTTVEVRPRGSPEPWVPKPADMVRPPFRLHTMKSGETLAAVARRNGVSPGALAKANGLDKKASPYVGQTLKIPDEARTPTPKASGGTKTARAENVTPKAGRPESARPERSTTKRPTLVRKKR